jgi:hypothetical protein
MSNATWYLGLAPLRTADRRQATADRLQALETRLARLERDVYAVLGGVTVTHHPRVVICGAPVTGDHELTAAGARGSLFSNQFFSR